MFQKSFKKPFRCRFVPGHDAEEAEAQDQAAEHGADGQPSVGPRHRIRRRTGIRRRLLVVRSSRGREHPGTPDQSGRHLRFADSRDGRLKRTCRSVNILKSRPFYFSAIPGATTATTFRMLLKSSTAET